MKLQDLMLASLEFSLALMQYFLDIRMFIFIFRMGITTVCSCMLEICDLFPFRGDLINRLSYIYVETMNIDF